MNEKMFLYLSEPVKAKLILEIYEQKQVTTGQLSEKFSEIPQTTLYRHLRKMLADGILKVAGENHIRGTVEKVYMLGFDFGGNLQTMVEENDGEMYLQHITQYMLGILREFQEYAAKPDINLAGDGSGFSLAPVYATTEELTEALMKIGGIITELHANTPGGERRLHNLCIITTPPRQ